MDCIARFYEEGFTKTNWASFFYLVNFACIARRIGKREEKAKRVFLRASVVLFMRSFSYEGLFSNSGRWVAFCCPFSSCMSVSTGLRGPRYIHFLDTVLFALY